MRQVWELLRTLWAVGCIPVAALLLVVMVLCGFNFPFFLGISGGADPVVRWLFWALVLYFVGGGWFFFWVDQRYAGKLKRLAAEFQAQGFQPQVEVFAKMSDAYLGIDESARRLLAYPVDGAGHFSSWMKSALGALCRPGSVTIGLRCLPATLGSLYSALC
ncbi:TPA: hypothetical protein ACUUB5_001444 [Pseudomonas aeruginosa]|uniref:hypothetical protein n=1 Tax=Pseudomonas aeruginosa TaxID=287 RepID=UPI001CF6F080|nr:hypothetical protein [Pseudomonas aeruginosa]MCG0481104.1 hypothetical protein [Pseudomonas aeruginosa]MCS7901395.1 hypothetical protein [Pseudomonas aeruginosa]MCU9107360.1 hypothetical protein [Pseudomonas aeruginosa]MDJ1426786.1 hypothetical protein [Pseudomonas aeruginosa]